MTSVQELRPEVMEQKIGAAFGAVGGVFGASMIHTGHKLGLYKALAGAGIATSADIAATTGLSERFIREWLLQQSASGIVDSHGGGKFSLSPEATLVFADEHNPASQIAMFAQFPALVATLTSAFKSFKTGVGYTYDDQGEDMARGMDASFGAWNRTALVPQALPLIPGLVDRLRAGARVADVGCGAGAGPIAIAQAFPNTTVDGYDNSTFALKIAEENKATAGVSNVTFHNPDVDPLPLRPTFDFVMTLDCLHDMPRPDLVAAAIRKAIKPDGFWFIVDIDGAPTPEGNFANPMAGFLYGASVAVCLQSSSSTPDGLGLGTFGLPEPAMRKLVAGAGFGVFERVAGLQHPFNAYYVARP